MSFDLLIIGSGVVGSALAIKTSQLGYKVAIIDSRETFPNSYRHLSVNQKSKAFLNVCVCKAFICNALHTFDFMCASKITLGCAINVQVQ